MAERASWYCGTMKAIPNVIGNRVTGYRYISSHGCGKVNRPNATTCGQCGRKRSQGKEIA